MANKNKPIHTVRDSNNGVWVNKREGSGRAISRAETKAEAVVLGKEQAKKDKTEHVIHNMDNKISEKNSYGNDPHPPKG